MATTEYESMMVRIEIMRAHYDYLKSLVAHAESSVTEWEDEFLVDLHGFEDACRNFEDA